MAHEITGVYEAETDVTAVELTDIAKRLAGVSESAYPANDPLQNSAKQCDGKGQNAYSFNSSYLPDTPERCDNTFKGSVMVHNCETPQQYAASCKFMAEYALNEWVSEISDDKRWGEFHLEGIINTVSEKFGFKTGIIEDTVGNTIENETNLTQMDVSLENVAQRESDGHDLVFLDESGQEVTVQVKTGGEQKKDADFLAKVDCKMDERKIEIEITR